MDNFYCKCCTKVANLPVEILRKITLNRFMAIALVFFVALTYVLISHLRRLTFVENVVISYAVLFFVAFIFTEALSAVNLLTERWVRIVWGVAVGVLLLIGLKKRAFSGMRIPRSQVNRYYVIVAIIALVTLLIAVISPITNADSLTYHLSRVMYWIQHQNVDWFATNNHRQVSYQPLAEYVIVQIKLLGGRDSLANLVQWCCFVGCLLNGFLISGLLGLSEAQKRMTVMLIATIPMAILQSSSTQNDLIAAFFVSLFLVGFLKYRKKQNFDAVLFLVAGVALGGLVKGTVYIFILPFCLSLAVFFMQNTFWKYRQMQAHILVLIGGFLVVNGAYFFRNYLLFDNIFGTSSLEISNEIHGFRPLVSNLVRQFTLQLGAWTPQNIWNDFLMNSVEAIHNFIGLSITDPRTTFGEYDIKRFSLSEDYAANTFHFVLLVIASVLSLFYQKKKDTRFYWLLIWSGLFIFVVLIKWQVFANRLLLPWFIIAMPLVAKSLDFSAWSRKLLVGLLVVGSLPFLLLNSTRPLISYNFLIDKILTSTDLPLEKSQTMALYRKGSILFVQADDFYAGQSDLEEIISVTEKVATKVTSVGLDVHRDFEDYLLLSRVIPRGVEVKHIRTEKPFNRLEEKQFVPEIIMSTRSESSAIVYHESVYSLRDSYNKIRVYQKNEF